MKTAVWAAVVLAVEVLLVWSYFFFIRVEPVFSVSAAEALLVGTVSVLVWLGFKYGFEQTLHRLVLAVVGGLILTFVMLFADLPTALVCERGRTEVEATAHIQGGRFEVYRVGGCTLYNPEARPVAGIRGLNDVGD